jgi:hypothetical protein
MTKASIRPWQKLFCALKLSVVLAATPAYAGEPQMGPFQARMTFSEFRAAAPSNIWQSKSFYDFGIVYTRAVSAYGGLDWLGRRFNIAYERTGYPSSQLNASIQFDAPTPKLCEARLSVLADDVDNAVGTAPPAWVSSPPPSFGTVDGLLKGFEYFHAAKATYGYVFPESEPTNRTINTASRIKLWKFQLKGSVSEYPLQRITAWRSYRMFGTTLVRILGSFDAAAPGTGLNRCLASVSFKTFGEISGVGSWPEFINETRALKDVLSHNTLASRYVWAMMPGYEQPVPKENALYYECDVDLVENRLRRCHANSDPAPDPATSQDSFARFLQKEAQLQVLMDETDFRPRTARIAAERLVPPADRAFDWSRAIVSASVAGVQGLQTQRLWGDYLQRFAPNRMEEEAAVTMRCLVMPDYSVFCGDHLVEPVAATRQYRRMADEFRRRAAFMKVKSTLASGDDSAGTYFTVRVVFRHGGD